MKHNRTVGYEIKTLDHLMMRQLISFGAKSGIDELTVMHGWIIGFLYNNADKKIFQKDIEREYSLSRSTVTGILKLMEKKGYITRKNDEHDGRLKQVLLTEKGAQLHCSTVKDIELLEKKTVEGIEEEELETFFRVIQKLKENCKNITE